MDIKDVELGTELKLKGGIAVDKFYNGIHLTKGMKIKLKDKNKVSAIWVNNGVIEFEDNPFHYPVSIFEPVEGKTFTECALEMKKKAEEKKMKKGKYVKDHVSLGVTIFGECEETNEYAIKYKHPRDGGIETDLVSKYNVKVKTVHDLEKGDKIKILEVADLPTINECKIVGVNYDYDREINIYLARIIEGHLEGRLVLVTPYDIEEIVLD